MPIRWSPATIESRIVAAFIWLLAGWTLCVHLAVIVGGSFSTLLGFAPIALLLACAGWWVTRHSERPILHDESNPRQVGWYFAAAVVLLSLIFGYFLFWSLAVFFILLAGYFATRSAGSASPGPQAWASNGGGEMFRLALLCGLAITLPLLIHQPDKDDSFYLSVATDAIRHPGRAIWSTDTIHDNPHLPVFLPIYKTEAFEHLIAVAAKLAHCSCIRADHTLLPMLFAIFVMLAWTMLARTIDSRHWFGITLTAVAILLLAGASRSSPANFAFTRLQQGKSVFAAGLVPVLCVYAWRLVNFGGWRNALLLIAAQIAGVGVSSTAILIGPLVTMAVAILAAPWVINWRARTPALRYSEEPDLLSPASGASAYLRTGVWINLCRIFAAGVSCIYPFALALLMRRQMLAVQWVEQSPMHHTGDEVKKVLGDGYQLWFFLACMLVGWLVVPRRSRRLILAPIVLLLTILINPLLTRYLQSHIFSPLTYWRGMWVVPWLIWSAAAVHGIATRLGQMSFIAGGGSPGLRPSDAEPGLPPPANREPVNHQRWLWRFAKRSRRGAIIALCLMPLAWHPLISRQNGTYFHLGGLSVDQDEYAVALALADRTPPGTAALAPELVSCWAATLDHRPPLIFVRPYYTQPNPIPGFDDAGMRNLLGLIAGQSNLTAKESSALIDGVGQYHLGTIVLRSDAGPIAIATLTRAGFIPATVNHYVLWVRPNSGLRDTSP